MNGGSAWDPRGGIPALLRTCCVSSCKFCKLSEPVSFAVEHLPPSIVGRIQQVGTTAGSCVLQGLKPAALTFC